ERLVGEQDPARAAVAAAAERVVDGADRLQAQLALRREHVERELQLALRDELLASRHLDRGLVVVQQRPAAVGSDVDTVDPPAQRELTQLERAGPLLVDAEGGLEQLRARSQVGLALRLGVEERLDLLARPLRGQLARG